VIDYVTSNVLLPIGALLTCVFVGWRLPRALIDEGYAQSSPWLRTTIVWMLRVACPIAILAVLATALAR
jgi:NSS family neurotransmitter:Na+ symporter